MDSITENLIIQLFPGDQDELQVLFQELTRPLAQEGFFNVLERQLFQALIAERKLRLKPKRTRRKPATKSLCGGESEIRQDVKILKEILNGDPITHNLDLSGTNLK